MIEKININGIEYDAIKYNGFNTSDVWAFIHCRISQGIDKTLSYFVRGGTNRGWNCAKPSDYIVKDKEPNVYFTYCEELKQ